MVVSIVDPETGTEMEVPKPATRDYCARCGLTDHHWPTCPAVGSDDRPVLPGCDG